MNLQEDLIGNGLIKLINGRNLNKKCNIFVWLLLRAVEETRIGQGEQVAKSSGKGEMPRTQEGGYMNKWVLDPP